MKQIAFVSGKGGTGKSTLVSSLCKLVPNKIIADCDVDAPNLHILLKGEKLHVDDFYGAKEAFIDSDKCIKCNKCKEVCRFDAISEDIEVLPFKCEGCNACALVCPVNAIKLEEVKTGQTFISNTEKGTFSHALLDPGAEGSGRLVTEVRENIKKYYKDEEWTLIDGSPGIGCVVIASITGADAVVVVTEPTQSGLSDLQRVLGVANHFGIPSYVCVNKFDLNLDITNNIEKYCAENDVLVVGKIKYDTNIIKALRNHKTPNEANNTEFTAEIESIWSKIQEGLSK